MFVDSLNQLSASQQITVDAVSGNTIDLGNVTPKRQIGTGEPMVVAVTIKAAGTNTGSMDIQVIDSAAANLSSPTVLGLRRLATADLAAGKSFAVAVPSGTPLQRYFGVNYDITGTVDVTVDAYLMPASMFSEVKPQAYADAITIS